MSNIQTNIHDVLEIKIKPIQYLGEYADGSSYTQEVNVKTSDGDDLNFTCHFCRAVNDVLSLRDEQEAAEAAEEISRESMLDRLHHIA